MRATAKCLLMCFTITSVFLVSHCTPSSSSTSSFAGSDDGFLYIGNGAEPRELDPSLAVGAPEGKILDNIFEGLTSLDSETLEVRPGMAESWTISEDGITYTFKIRKDAKWSDGKELTAEDFVWSWTRTLDPMTASEYAYQLYYIKNGEAYNTGKLKDASQLGVKAVDKHTLKVELDHPTPFFLKLATFRTLFPTPKHVISKFDGLQWTNEGNIVSNGPFKLTEWRLNQHIKVVPNTHYWDKDSVKIKGAMFLPIENSDTEEKMFHAGKVHITATIPSLRIPEYREEAEAALAKNQETSYRATPILATYFYRFNVTRKPLNDPRVRKALNLAIDRESLVENVLKGGQIPSNAFTPPIKGYEFSGEGVPTTVTAENIAEAKRLLKEAGYPDGKGMDKIDILYNTSEDHKKIAVALQSMWKENLGIRVGLYNQEWKVYLDTMHNLDFGIARGGWVGDYPDPNTFLDMFVTNGGNNNTGWSNKDYDKYIDLASQTADDTERFEYFHKAEAILMKELPILPLYIYTTQKLVSPKMKSVRKEGVVSWTPNFLDNLILRDVVLESPETTQVAM